MGLRNLLQANFRPPPHPCHRPPLTEKQRYAPQALIHALEGQSLDTASSLGTLHGDEQSMYKAIQDLAKEEVRRDFLRFAFVGFVALHSFLFLLGRSVVGCELRRR